MFVLRLTVLMVSLGGAARCGGEGPGAPAASKSTSGGGARPSAKVGAQGAGAAQGEATPGASADATAVDGGASAGSGANVAEPGAWPSVGVDVCDAFLAEAKACLDGRSDEAAANLRAQILEDAGYWKQTVDGGGSASAVAIGCETAQRQLEPRREALGCVAAPAPRGNSKSPPP